MITQMVSLATSLCAAGPLPASPAPCQPTVPCTLRWPSSICLIFIIENRPNTSLVPEAEHRAENRTYRTIALLESTPVLCLHPPPPALTSGLISALAQCLFLMGTF